MKRVSNVLVSNATDRDTDAVHLRCEIIRFLNCSNFSLNAQSNNLISSIQNTEINFKMYRSNFCFVQRNQNDTISQRFVCCSARVATLLNKPTHAQCGQIELSVLMTFDSRSLVGV